MEEKHLYHHHHRLCRLSEAKCSEGQVMFRISRWMGTRCAREFIINICTQTDLRAARDLCTSSTNNRCSWIVPKWAKEKLLRVRQCELKDYCQEEDEWVAFYLLWLYKKKTCFWAPCWDIKRHFLPSDSRTRSFVRESLSESFSSCSMTNA